MGGFNLAEYIYYCEIDDQRVFLDLNGDRYFSLPVQANAAFSSLLAAAAPENASPADIDPLLQAGIIVAAPRGKPIKPTGHPRPTRSLIEEAVGGAAPSLREVAEVGLFVLGARRAVLKARLPRLLGALARRRAAGLTIPGKEREGAIGKFLVARRFIPVAPNCLYDSLALCRFLQRRGIAVDLVIGAKLHPFGAHCWLQDGTTVLNDSLSAARDFAPVFVA